MLAKIQFVRWILYSTLLTAFLLSTFAIISCNNPSSASASDSSKFQVLRDSNTAIVMSSLDDSYKPGDRLPFTVTAAHFILIDSLLLKSVDTYNKSHDTGNGLLTIDLINSHYKRQIIPSIKQNGEKLVSVNCFCSSFENWRNSVVIVGDGGKCYFKLWINLDTSQVEVFL